MASDNKIPIDLARYGLEALSHLPRSRWTEADVDALLDAMSAEGVAPSLNIDFNLQTIKLLLDTASCRRCGRCCLPKPGQPAGRAMAREDELKEIARRTGLSHRQLVGYTGSYKLPRLKHFRFIKLPCPFYEPSGCRIYDFRPLVCRCYPITDTPRQGGRSFVKINIGCDYGRDVYKAVHRILVQEEAEAGGSG